MYDGMQVEKIVFNWKKAMACPNNLIVAKIMPFLYNEYLYVFAVNCADYINW